jgi:hypothetical protein
VKQLLGAVRRTSAVDEVAASLEIVARTVHRTPEVVVKVLTCEGQSLGAVGRHFNYLDRDGELPIETDDGRQLNASSRRLSMMSKVTAILVAMIAARLAPAL